MSLETRVRDAMTRIATEFNNIATIRGDEATLNTTASNLVDAINEILALANSSTSINDAAPGLTTTYSSTKIEADLQQAFTDFVGAAPASLDEWAELVAEIQSNDGDLATVFTALSNRVRTDTAAQGLTVTQQGNARANIGAASSVDLATLTTDVGDTDRDFVADFTGALA